ncbi:MAG TPA: hypothetical protein VF477_12965, partial [Mycobacterium sp.]
DKDGKTGTDASSSTDKTKKDKPSLNVVRNSPNASTDAKPGEKTGASEGGSKGEGAKKDEPAGGAASSASSEGGSSSSNAA